LFFYILFEVVILLLVDDSQSQEFIQVYGDVFFDFGVVLVIRRDFVYCEPQYSSEVEVLEVRIFQHPFEPLVDDDFDGG